LDGGNFQKLSSESVEGASLALEGVHDIHGGHGLAASVLGVGDGITDDILKEDLEDSAGLFVDESRDALDTTTAGQTADGGLGDSRNVVTQNLAMTLGSSLAESFSSFSSSAHFCLKERRVSNKARFFFVFFFFSFGH